MALINRKIMEGLYLKLSLNTFNLSGPKRKVH